MKSIGCGVTRRVYETTDNVRLSGDNGTRKRLLPSSWQWSLRLPSWRREDRLLFQPIATRPKVRTSLREMAGVAGVRQPPPHLRQALANLPEDEPVELWQQAYAILVERVWTL